MVLGCGKGGVLARELACIGMGGLGYLEVQDDLSYKGPIDKFIPDDMKAEIRELAGLSAGDRAALKPILRAAQAVDRLFYRQMWDGNEALAEAINRQALNDTVIYCLILQKGKEQGLDQVTDEEKAAFTDSAKEQWEGIVSSFVASLGTVTDESTDEDKAAARADAEALLQSQ